MLYRLYCYLAGQHGLEECFYVQCDRILETQELALVEWLVASPLRKLLTSHDIAAK